MRSNLNGSTAKVVHLLGKLAAVIAKFVGSATAMSESKYLGASATGRQVIFPPLQRALASFSLALSLSATAGLTSVSFADDVAATTALRKVSVDANRKVVFEFATDGAKTPSPKLFEMPVPNHRLIMDLPGASMDMTSLASADQISAAVTKVLPGVSKVRFATLINQPQPTVRVTFDLAISTKVKPALRMEDGALALGLNEEFAQPVTAVAEQTVTSSATTDAYSQYADAMMAQKIEAPKKDDGAWGPRKGNASELKGLVGGIKPLVTSSALKVPTIEPVLTESLPTAKETSAPGVVPQPAGETAQSQTETNQSSSEMPALRDTTPDPAVSAAAVTETKTETVAETTTDTAPEKATETAQTPVVAASTAPIRRATPPAAVPAEPPQSTPEAQPEATTETANANESGVAEAPKIKARRLFNSAVKAHMAGNVDQAIADYKAALASDAELGDAYSNLGLAYNQQHNYNDALVQFRKALAIHPADAITYNGIGAALRAQKDVPGAIKNWETAVKLSPKLAVAHYNLGTAYESQGDLDRAMVSYKNATQNDARLGEAFYRMGLIMWKKNKTEDAKENFRVALKISPNSDYSQDARNRLAMSPKAK